MATWLVPLTDLTTDQLRAVELSSNQHRVIIGGPGSGKTIVLLHRARYLCERLKVKNGAFKIFVYTNTLKNYIKSAVDLLDLPQDSIINLDAWCRTYFTNNISRIIPMVDGHPDFPKIRQQVLNHLQHNNQIPFYDFILVDEGQDLDPTAYEIFKLIGRHITVAMDHKQQLYELGLGEADVLKVLGINAASVSFLDSYRCSEYIVNLACPLIEDIREREEYVRQTRTIVRDIETPVIYQAKNARTDEKDKLISTVRSRLLNNDRIAVLFPQRRMVFGYAKGFEAAGLEVETMDNIDFTSDCPKLLTYQSAKGLTFDTVIMPRLVNNSFLHVNEAILARQIFVGITRATRWVYLSTVDGQVLPVIQNLIDCTDRNKVTVMCSGENIAPQVKSRTADPNPDNQWLDLF